VRRRPDGLYDRIGRKDRQVKVRGARVELDGVEAAIRRHASVRDVAVVPRIDDAADADRPLRLVAYIQLHDTASEDSLREVGDMMRRTVPSQMQPCRYYATPQVPRLPNSKLDGRALRAMDLAKCNEEADARADALGNAGIAQDSVEILVARTWCDVLGLAGVAADDDFFAVGGDSLRAITMTVELERALGRELPINLISQTPAFAAFCQALNRHLKQSGPAIYSPLVVLKPGRGLPPLFFIHGLGGSVMELFTIARKIIWSGAVIGIQARGLDGRDQPHRRVAAMTDEYFRAVKLQQPTGPYLLCGYSFGGLVAFELARRLSANGDEVAFVGLIGTLPPGHHLLRLWTWVAYLYRRAMKGAFGGRQAASSINTDRQFAPIVNFRRGQTITRRLASGAQKDLRAVAVSALFASVAYRPGTYHGELTFFEPDRRDLGVPAAAIHWRRHASKLRRHSLHGRHDDILIGTNAEGTAALLTRCLEAAIAESPGFAEQEGALAAMSK
jgi:thioesterase domain-containing protein/acyl carrier protein